MKDEHKTPVVFRRFIDKGDIIALFPTICNDHRGNVMSYQHIGQHSGADYGLISTEYTMSVSEEEYKPLFDELESIGYNLEVWSIE